jgi:hypothetical protein
MITLAATITAASSFSGSSRVVRCRPVLGFANTEQSSVLSFRDGRPAAQRPSGGRHVPVASPSAFTTNARPCGPCSKR